MIDCQLHSKLKSVAKNNSKLAAIAQNQSQGEVLQESAESQAQF